MLATDESIIFDICGDFFGEEPCDLTPIEKLGLEVTERDIFWEVAARMEKLQESLSKRFLFVAVLKSDGKKSR